MIIQTKYSVGDKVLFIPHKRKTIVKGEIWSVSYYKKPHNVSERYNIIYNNSKGLSCYEEVDIDRIIIDGIDGPETFTK